MSENRTARNEAWIASLVLHAGLLAGVIASVGRPRGNAEGPIVVDTRASSQTIGVVMLDEPVARAAPPPPIVVPIHQNALPAPKVPLPPPGPVRPVIYEQQAAPVPAADIRPVVENHPPTAASEATPVTQAPAVPPVANDSGSPLPAGATTSFFGVPAIGKSVVFVLDRSASMGLDGRLDRARRELAASLRRLPPSARFQVIAYNKVAEPVRLPGANGLVPATQDAVEAVIAAMGRLSAEGGSEHLQALTAALALGPDVIYFLTDEDDLEIRDVQTATRTNRGRACVHALCLVPPPAGESPMQMLARNNRGQFQVVR